jgi:hypothetical protein
MTTPDLPPDVRAEAAAAVYELSSVDTDDSATFAHAVVDAVVSVVAPEIERPLQARIEELEGALRVRAKESLHLSRLLAQEQLEKEELTTGSISRLADIANAMARVEVLTAALTEILELIEYQDRPVARIKVRARAALAAGEEKSDA